MISLKNTFRLCVLLWTLYGCESTPLKKEAGSNSPVEAKSSDWPIVTAVSWLTIEVHKGGVLAKVGHNHILVSHQLTGQISRDRTEGHISVPLKSLSIDESDLRKKLGWEPVDSEYAIQGTRRNMNRYVLQTDQFPDARIDVLCPVPFRNTCQGGLTLHGVTQKVANMPVQIKVINTQVVVTGSYTLLQTDFGIKPFSVLDGILRVENPVIIRYYLVFEKRVLPD